MWLNSPAVAKPLDTSARKLNWLELPTAMQQAQALYPPSFISMRSGSTMVTPSPATANSSGTTARRRSPCVRVQACVQKGFLGPPATGPFTVSFLVGRVPY